MGSHKAQQRAKQRGERDKAKPPLQQSAPPRIAQANGKIAPPAAAPRMQSPLTSEKAPHSPESGLVSVEHMQESASQAAIRAEGASAPAREDDTPPAPSATSSAPTTQRGPHMNGSSDGHSTKHVTQRAPTPPGELSEMFATLRDLFVQDRANASRPDAARCGICYLTFPRDHLVYREAEGYYACPECARALNGARLPMLRRQRK